MRKPIFESEEEAFGIFDEILEVQFCNHDKCVRDMIIKAKQAGYIRRSPVEEADDMYLRFVQESEFKNALPLIDKQHEAIQYLKKQLEEK